MRLNPFYFFIYLSILSFLSCSTNDEIPSNSSSEDENENVELVYYKTTFTTNGVENLEKLLEFDNSNRIVKITNNYGSAENIITAVYTNLDTIPSRITSKVVENEVVIEILFDYIVTAEVNRIMLENQINGGYNREFEFTNNYIDKDATSDPTSGDIIVSDLYYRDTNNNILRVIENGSQEFLYSNHDTEHFNDPFGGALQQYAGDLGRIVGLKESKNTPLSGSYNGQSWSEVLIYTDNGYVKGFSETNPSTGQTTTATHDYISLD